MSFGLNFGVRTFVGYVNYENTIWEYTPFQMYFGLAGSLVILVLIIVCSCKLANKCKPVEHPSPDGITVDDNANNQDNYLISPWPAQEAYLKRPYRKNVQWQRRSGAQNHRSGNDYYSYANYRSNSGEKVEAGGYLEQHSGGRNGLYMMQSTSNQMCSAGRDNRKTDKGYQKMKSTSDAVPSKHWHNQRQGNRQGVNV